MLSYGALKQTMTRKNLSQQGGSLDVTKAMDRGRGKAGHSTLEGKPGCQALSLCQWISANVVCPPFPSSGREMEGERVHHPLKREEEKVMACSV